MNWGNYFWSFCWFAIICQDSVSADDCSGPPNIHNGNVHVSVSVFLHRCLATYVCLYVWVVICCSENWVDKVPNKICSTQCLWFFKWLPFVNCQLRHACWYGWIFLWTCSCSYKWIHTHLHTHTYTPSYIRQCITLHNKSNQFKISVIFLWTHSNSKRDC